MSQLSDRLETIPMTLVAEYRGFVEGEWPHFAWTVSLEYQGRKYSSPYRTGIGHAKPRLGCNRVSGGISTPRGNMKELAACRAGYMKRARRRHIVPHVRRVRRRRDVRGLVR